MGPEFGLLGSGIQSNPSQFNRTDSEPPDAGKKSGPPCGADVWKSNSPEICSYGEYVDWLKERIQKAHEVARKHLEKSAKSQKEAYDAKSAVNSYKPGDMVSV